MATRILTLLFISFFAEAQHKANFKAAEKFSQENLSKYPKGIYNLFVNTNFRIYSEKLILH